MRTRARVRDVKGMKKILSILFLLMLCVFVQARLSVGVNEVLEDSVVVVSDTSEHIVDAELVSNDTISSQNDSVIQSDSIGIVSLLPQPVKKETIDAKIEYSSQDSVVITGTGIAYLYGAGEIYESDSGIHAHAHG